MPRQVSIAAGKTNIVLPNGGSYKAGDVVTLTDEQWSLIPQGLVPGTVIDGGELDIAGSHRTRVAGSAATNVVLPNGAVAKTGDVYPLTEDQYARMSANAKSTTTTTTGVADKVEQFTVGLNLASLANGRVLKLQPTYNQGMNEPFRLLPGAALSGGAAPIVSGVTVGRNVPQMPGRILSLDAVTTVIGAGAGATATLTLTVSGVAVTGGSLVLSLASQNAVGNITSASAITAANTFNATDYLTIEAASVTAFTAGRVVVRVTILGTGS